MEFVFIRLALIVIVSTVIISGVLLNVVLPAVFDYFVDLIKK